MNSGDSKATPNGSTSTNILKSTVNIRLPCKTNIINLSIEGGHSSDKLKHAEVSPIFYKKDDFGKGKYRLVSVLPYVSKVFERNMYHQINEFMTNKLSKKINRI